MTKNSGKTGGARKRVMVLGNCVAERLQAMLARYPGFGGGYEIVPAPAVHTLLKAERLQSLAATALACDVVFTQPLFNFGPCNTEALRTAPGWEDAAGSGNEPADGRNGRRLVLFASPDFEAYFPDAVHLAGKENPRFEPILDWDSSIIFSCFCRGVSIFEVEDIYFNHPLFRPEAAKKTIAASLERYIRREQGLDLPTREFVFRNYAGTKLFHSPKHPADELLRVMLRDMAVALGLEKDAPAPEPDGFGFNQWPLVTRHHEYFSFVGQEYFMLAGQRRSLEDTAMAYYNFYEFHPHVVEANKDKIIPV